MYRNLGIHWASSIPAFLSLTCLPFPFLFYKYGEKIRSKCRYSAEAAAILQEMMTIHQAADEEEGTVGSSSEEKDESADAIKPAAMPSGEEKLERIGS
ncbi:Efflux pump fub11 [Claviceps lovelessii]|nr:Efflux pump fub11 [Claviceps lovelessii]